MLQTLAFVSEPYDNTNWPSARFLMPKLNELEVWNGSHSTRRFAFLFFSHCLPVSEPLQEF